MAQQLELDLRGPAPVVSLSEYRRGWRAARALRDAGFNPDDQLPPSSPEDPDELAFALGWRRFCKEVGHAR